MSWPTAAGRRSGLLLALIGFALLSSAGNAWADRSPTGAAASVQTASITGLAGNLLSPITTGTGAVDPITAGAGALANVGLNALGSWVLDGARAALQETAGIISRTTAPQLESTWFSATYWRVAGLAALMTVPFLFAAGVQALLRSDLAMLGKAALGYLPLALVGVSLAAPLAMLLLAATDQMSAVVEGAGSGGGAHFLAQTAIAVTGLSGLDGSPFLAFAVGLFTLGAALALAIELLVREAAVYVVLLMLPLAFAGLVWPARRIWAVRMVELLVALILSKFVIVAVLSLAGAAYGQTGAPSVTRLLTAMSLLILSTFAPWVMLRLLPFTELAAGAAGALSAEVPRLRQVAKGHLPSADGAAAWTESLAGRMGRQADDAGQTGEEPGTFAGPDWTSAAPGPALNGSSGGASAGQTGPVPVATPAATTAAGATGAAGAIATPVADTQPISAPEADARPGPRLPGMDPIWQAENGAWPPMNLGPGGWSGPTEYVPPADGVPPAPEPADDDPPRPSPQSEPDGLL